MNGALTAHSPVPDSMYYGEKMRKSNIPRRHILMGNPSHPGVDSSCLVKDSISCHQTSLIFTHIFRRRIPEIPYPMFSFRHRVSLFSP